ncbi:hypothetical protein BRADI_5g07920v3 [Brachypodium distachyon]|uniref:Uncharacterized protein n=1 Tax=Brachypodium distachyon TaxID=15368 RepID=I1IX31_BRADI|nr:hypothetical protein BRADI_5g07920v3 [Brachypodium distachyon]
MSTCSTAHSRSHARACPRPHCNLQDAINQRCAACLERRLSGLERQWDEYKTSRRTAAARPRHRRSRSDTTPSSAVVTGAGPETPGGHFPIVLCSPRKLLSSLQQAASSSDASAGAGAVTVGDAIGIGNGKRSRARRYEEDDIQDASSVCSVDAAVAMAAAAAASSCSCSCECTIPRCPCGYGCGYSSISSCSGSTAATSLFSLGEGNATAVAAEMRKTEGGSRWTACGVGRFAAIAVAGVAVLGAVAVAVVEFGMDDGRMEFLVPT